MRSWSAALLLQSVLSLVQFAAATEVPYVEGQKPPVSGPNECWCVVSVPAVYKTVTESVCVEPGGCREEVIPAQFETRTERICVRPESRRAIPGEPRFRTETITICVQPEVVRREYTPPVFETREEKILIRPAYTRRIPLPPVQKQVSEQVVVEPARSEWKQIECPTQPGLLAPNESKEACWCYVTYPARVENVTRQVTCAVGEFKTEEVPAEYRTIVRQVKVRDECWKEVREPAKFETVERQVPLPECVQYETIPAEFAERQTQVCVKPESRRRVPVPASYETRTREVLVSPARKVWRKVDCADAVKATLPAANGTSVTARPGTDEIPLLPARPKAEVSKADLGDVPTQLTDRARDLLVKELKWAANVSEIQFEESAEVETRPGVPSIYALTARLSTGRVRVKLTELGVVVKAERLSEEAQPQQKK